MSRVRRSLNQITAQRILRAVARKARTPTIGARGGQTDADSAEIVRLRTQLADAEKAARAARVARRAAAAERNAAREEAAEWRRRLEQPSFLRHHHAWVELGKHYRQDPSPAKERIGELNRKLWVHAFATSHGVPVPRILGLAQRPEDMDLAALPAEFVVKTDGGASSRAVLPLRRVGEDQYLWIGHEPTMALTTAQVIEHFQRVRALTQSYGPVFAEQMLESVTGSELPDDVKIYMAYGKVLHVLLRRPTMVNGKSTAVRRYLSEAGRDLGQVVPEPDLDPTIPVPTTLPQMLEIARRISLALPMPLCRVDLYETAQGPVLGEITRTPGATHRYAPRHDDFLGREWMKAEARLFEDMHHGRSGRPTWGPHADLGMIDRLPPFPSGDGPSRL